MTLVNLRARHYDPETGTFTAKDPLGVTGSINSYQYCNNDPINLSDPNGNYNIYVDYATVCATPSQHWWEAAVDLNSHDNHTRAPSGGEPENLR